MKAKLDFSELQIERTASSFRPLTKKKLRKVEEIIERANQPDRSLAGKSRNINIRISEEDLEQLKRRSQEEGLPYQTLIASILRKYLTNRLVDEAEIRRSIELLHPER